VKKSISIVTPNKIYYKTFWKHTVFIFRWSTCTETH